MAQVVNTIPAQIYPGGIVVINGNIWVANDNTQGTVTVINSSNVIVNTITVGNRATSIYNDDTHVYVTNFNSNSISKILISNQTIVSTISINRPFYIVGDTNYLYVTNYSNNGIVSRIKKSDQSITGINVGVDPYFMSIDSTYIWVSNNNGSISRIKISDLTVTTQHLGLGNSCTGIYSDGNYVWATNNSNNTISKINRDTPLSVISTISVGPSSYFITGDTNDNLWLVSNVTPSGTVKQINKNTGTVIKTITVGNNPIIAFTNNTYVWVTNLLSNTVSQILITPIICFKQDTKILTNKGYLPIQDLRKGDLVKTLKNDYVPIDMIGKKEIYHFASEERIKDQLYKCSKEEYPEVFEDLVLTGCHCILVDEFKSEEEKEKTVEVNGDIYITDNKYRLPACVDKKTKVYENKGNHTIYHFALENKDYYMNYGVFANGLLVETTSKRFMKELSGMELI